MRKPSSAGPWIWTPASPNRSGLEAAADDSEKLHALLERLVARQQEANALKRRADEILAETAVKYDDIQARMERLVRSEKMDADIDTFVALNNIRTRVDIEVRTRRGFLQHDVAGGNKGFSRQGAE